MHVKNETLGNELVMEKLVIHTRHARENGLARENTATGGFQQPKKQKCNNQALGEGRAKHPSFSQIPSRA